MKTLVLLTIGKVSAGAAGLAMLVGLAGCFDNDPGMQERLIRTQVELQEQRQKLQNTEAALAKAQAALKAAAAATPPPAAVSSADTVPSKEQLNDGYIKAAKDMRDRLKNELNGYSILNCTLYEVSTVAAMPYTSKVAVALRSDKGQQYKLEMPVGADTAGKWKFPTTQEILDNVSKVPAQTSNRAVAAANQALPFQPRSQERAPAPPPVSGMGNEGGVETVQFNWSQSQTRSTSPSSGQGRSGSSSAASVVPPPVPAPAAPRQAAPQQPASQPVQAMPADQSVLVTF